MLTEVLGQLPMGGPQGYLGSSSSYYTPHFGYIPYRDVCLRVDRVLCWFRFVCCQCKQVCCFLCAGVRCRYQVYDGYAAHGHGLVAGALFSDVCSLLDSFGA